MTWMLRMGAPVLPYIKAMCMPLSIHRGIHIYTAILYVYASNPSSSPLWVTEFIPNFLLVLVFIKVYFNSRELESSTC